MENKIISLSPTNTKKLGENLAKKILKGKIKKRILLLEGELGSGKTTFLKGFAKGLSIKERILSPSFVIFKRFEIKKSKKFKNFYHFDCYRIKDKKEILKLGLKKILKDPKNIVAFEWPEIIEKIIPNKKIKIIFQILGKRKRKIIFEKNSTTSNLQI